MSASSSSSDDNNNEYNSDEAADVPTPSGVACLQINKVLARAEETAGEFTFGGQADMLPVAPGLFVDGKSPFGRKHETLIDENVRKGWQLESGRVEFKNPLWHSGMEKLSTTIANRLGYEGTPLQCVLYKLLVYGEGGHFTKHKDTEKEDGMIATLVLQPPNLHEGGDLVVYRDTTTEYRHDFGKKDATAAYLPHYAVHYADAEHALENVTKGYRLALVYSICLPRTVRQLRRNHCQSLSEEKSIEELGSGALKGIDRARFHALEEASNAVMTDKKLCFYIAQLSHEIEFRDDNIDMVFVRWWSTLESQHL
ncbi:hypothetical protein BBP00_00004913 [Phytophthora kernoviae]|nr:hypothetical protein BBP00_00004913 [Phytophthora kernoviae]